MGRGHDSQSQTANWRHINAESIVKLGKRETQTRLADALLTRGCRARDSADASLPDHAFQSTDIAHDGDLVSHAALVAVAHDTGFAANSHDRGQIVDGWPLVGPNRTRNTRAANTRRNVARAAKPL